MTWLAESSPTVMLVCGIAAVVLLLAWRSTGRPQLLWGVAAAVLVAAGAWLWDWQVTTPHERVIARVYELCDSFERGDPQTVEFISESAPGLRLQMMAAVRLIRVEGELSVTDVSGRLSNEDSRAVTHFRANGAFNYLGFGSRQYPTRWNVTWRLEEDEWRVIEAQSLDPITGEPRDLPAQLRQ